MASEPLEQREELPRQESLFAGLHVEYSMVRGHEPTEEYDGSITVRTFDDDGGRNQTDCDSFEEAIDLVKDVHHAVEVVEMIHPNGDVVFDSSEMDIDNWAAEWKHAKRRQSVDVEERECPYDNVACFADDLCVRCKIDKVQEQH